MKKLNFLILIFTALLVSGNAWGDVVAKVGDVSYDNLLDAVAASTEATPAVLQRSVNLSEAIEIGKYETKIACLDLNGYTITSAAEEYAIGVKSKGFTIMDNSAGHTGCINHVSGKELIYSHSAFVTDSIIITIKQCTLNAEKEYYAALSLSYAQAKWTKAPIIVNMEDATINCPDTWGFLVHDSVEINLKNVNINATGEDQVCIANNGSNEIASKVNIIGGTLTSESGAIYWPGIGSCKLSGVTINNSKDASIEMRSGELTIDNCTFINTDATPVTFSSNYNGATCTGSCNIALAQHSTKNTIMVTINSGTFSAVTPVAQANPQENDSELSKLVKCYIKGGLFYSSNSGQPILKSGEKNRIFATAGFYNTEPSATCIAQGYSAIPITTSDYPTQYAAGYRWRIGLTGKSGEDQTKTEGDAHDWSKEASDVWQSGNEPTAGTDVTINGKDVIVTTVAQAYGVTIANAETASLTIKNTGTLVVGKGGVTNADNTKFTVEGDGVLAIAPENTNQPLGTVEYIAKYAGLKNGKSSVSAFDDVYWEQMAIPTVENSAGFVFTEPDPSIAPKNYYNTWDITEGWQLVNKSAVKQPYKGYFMANSSAYSADLKQTTYTFTGVLVGNQVNLMKFNREGFTFFGNSFTAPIGIPELLQKLNTDDVEATVYLYRPLQASYYTINMATTGRGGRPTEINKLQGFFVYAKAKANVTAEYKDVVWDALMAKLSMGSSAPARKAAKVQSEIDAAATLVLTSAKGWTDDLVLIEGENMTDDFDQNYDARKLSGDHHNVFVPADADMAVYAVSNMIGTPITLKTSEEVAYTFTFTDVDNNEWALYDAQNNSYTPMVEGNSYSFVANAKSTISNRFSVRRMPDVSTNMENVRAKKAQGIYTIMGQYIGETTDYDQLPNGVYVINGEKVVK